MRSLLTPEEFAGRAVGLPWRRWAASWQAADCFGLVVLYFREVLGVELGPVPETDIAAGFAVAEGWRETPAGPAAVAFMAWRAGAPTHCGIVLSGGRLLHSEGSEDHPGAARVSRMTAVSRVYGDLKFYRYAQPCP